MQINAISISTVAINGADAAIARRRSSAGSDQARLHGVEDVEQALKEMPAIRIEEVERAKKLIATVHYPPNELIDGLSRLLAQDWVQSS